MEVFRLGSGKKPNAIVLRFESGSTTVSVSDFDSVEIVSAEPQLSTRSGKGESTSDSLPSPLTRASPWARLMGTDVVWAWVLTNNQGFSDGIQIEFIDLESRVTTIVQLMAEGGSLDVRFFEPGT